MHGISTSARGERRRSLTPGTLARAAPQALELGVDPRGPGRLDRRHSGQRAR
jgi:hypothetical protein